MVLTGRYYQEINGKRVLLERGDFVFIDGLAPPELLRVQGDAHPLTSASADAALKHYLPLLPFGLVASQVYAVQSAFSAYVESVICLTQFHARNGIWANLSRLVSFYVFINRFAPLS